MEAVVDETEKEYMLFLLKCINNYLVDQEVPSWFSLAQWQKPAVEPEPEVEPEK